MTTIDVARLARNLRRQRAREEGLILPDQAPVPRAPAPLPPPLAEDEAAERGDLLRSANTAAPRPEAMAMVRALFDADPTVWQGMRALTQLAQDEVLSDLSQSWLRREVLARELALRRDELGYAEALAMERTLIEHAVLCWVRLQKAELAYTSAQREPQSVEHADHWERRLSAAQRRYLRAVETLARVRRLCRPGAPLQVNIAGQQVNQVLAGGETPSEH